MTKKKVDTGTVLRLHRATARGFAGFGSEEQSLDFDPQVTILQGRNASAKSTWLEVIRYGLGIVRAAASRRAHVEPSGAELTPEITITLAGEGREVEVRRKGDGSPEVRERTGEDWRKVPRPVEWLRQLVDAAAADPNLFVAAKDDERAALLLEALELPGYSRAEALASAGLEAFPLPPIPAGLHPLDDLERVRKAVYDARTGTNTKAREEEAAAEHLLAGLPAEPPAAGPPVDALAEKVEAERAAIEAEAARVRSERWRQADQIQAAYTAQKERLRAAHEAKAAELRAVAEKRIAELRAEMEAAVDAAKTAGEQQLDALDAGMEAAEAAIEQRRLALAAERERLAALRAQAESAATDRHVRATAEEGRKRARALKDRSEALTRALEDLKRYATDLAGKLPIKGLEVTYDDRGRRLVTLDRVPLDQVNSGRLRELASEVSALQLAARGEEGLRLPLVLIDWLEQVDAERRAEHLQSLAAGGAQVVAAVVDVGDFRALRGAKAVA